MRVRTLCALALLAPVATAVAQQQPPENWRWYPDAPATLVPAQHAPTDTAYRFVTMPPGFHVTTGPGLIAHHPDARASGRYTVRAEIFLFPATKDGEYGIFLGGDALGTPGARYLAVVLRADGAVSVMQREGEALTTIAPWATHDSIAVRTKGVVKNVLAVQVADSSLTVMVNGTEVATAAIAPGRAAGAFGIRAGRGVDLHVGTLDHVRHFAPPAPPRKP